VKGQCQNTVDLILKDPPRLNSSYVCFKHANTIYATREIAYIWNSEICQYHLITEQGWEIIEDRNQQEIDNKGAYKTSRDDLEAITTENFTPLNGQKEELTRFDIMSEFVADMNDRVQKHFADCGSGD
jgi:hypothetical protein